MKLNKSASAAIKAKAAAKKATGKGKVRTVAAKKATGKAVELQSLVKSDKAKKAAARMEAKANEAKAKREVKVKGANKGAKGVFAYVAGNGDKVHDGVSNAGTRSEMAKNYGVSVAALIGRKINVDECAALRAFLDTNAKALKFTDSNVTFKSGESKRARVCVKAGIGTHAGAGNNAGKTLVFALAWAEKVGATATAEKASFVYGKRAGAMAGKTIAGNVVSRVKDSEGNTRLTVRDSSGALHTMEDKYNGNNGHIYGAIVSC